MKKILVLCTGNSCRSQMAEGYLRKFNGPAVMVYSAGIEAHGLNPLAVASMGRDGIDISGQTSNLVDEYKDIQFDLILTVCDNANEKCPYIAGKAKRVHYNFPDPAKFVGEKKKLDSEFDRVRDLIRKFCKDLIIKEAIV